jgi:tRNA1(Val) A37 N6-methylase TrmN6
VDVTELSTVDRFLGGRIAVSQPARGFRAGHDSVLLAAAVPAAAGDDVLELGSGAGVASLALAARVPGVRIVGVEIDRELARLADDNAARNGMSALRFICRDVESLGPEMFDHVFFNPPFHRNTGQVSPLRARDAAKREVAGAVLRWTEIALERVKPGGTVTAIVSADREADMLAATGGNGATVFPLFPHAGEAPKRIIVQFRKGADEPARIATGLVLHEADGRNTEAAEAVLRHAGSLELA